MVAILASDRLALSEDLVGDSVDEDSDFGDSSSPEDVAGLGAEDSAEDSDFGDSVTTLDSI